MEASGLQASWEEDGEGGEGGGEHQTGGVFGSAPQARALWWFAASADGSMRLVGVTDTSNGPGAIGVSLNIGISLNA